MSLDDVPIVHDIAAVSQDHKSKSRKQLAKQVQVCISAFLS